MLTLRIVNKMLQRRHSNLRYALVLIGIILFVFYLHNGGWPCGNGYGVPDYKGRMIPKDDGITVEKDNEIYTYDREMPLVFIGGVPRSGTTLMRAMLDAHDEIRCGEETRLIPRLLGMRQSWKRSPKEWNRLAEAGLTDSVINDALSAFILEIIAKHGEPAPRLCNKDPFTLKSMTYLQELFPNAKYLLMVRDGRATAHSIISRKVTISGFDITSYRDCLQKWNLAIENMYGQCMQVGSQYCLPVFYEQLVLHPEPQLRKILEFLDLPWDEHVMHHEQAVGKPGGISLSKVERSTDQVVKPVNIDALSNWVGQIPQDVVDDMAYIAPMLQRLGYDPRANPPHYGTPDKVVLDNTERAKVNKDQYDHKIQDVAGDQYIKDYMMEPRERPQRHAPPKPMQDQEPMMIQGQGRMPDNYRNRGKFRKDILPNYRP